MARCAVATTRAGQAATDRAQALGVMPFRARVEPATTAVLDALACTLPPSRLGRSVTALAGDEN